MRKYKTDVSVTWSIVLKAVELQIMRERKAFESHNDEIIHELTHNDVDMSNLRKYVYFSLLDCQKVFYWYGALCSLREFLGMRSKTPEQLKISQCFDFFNQYFEPEPEVGLYRHDAQASGTACAASTV